jgi:uncharacterized protein YjbI with pentapeptide repeats
MIDVRKQVVTGVVPPQVDEAIIREVFPSVASFPLAPLAKRLQKSIILAPFGWLLLAVPYFGKVLPGLARRYTLTNRRLMIRRGMRPVPVQEIPLADIDEIRQQPDSYDDFFRAANLEVLSQGKVVMTLPSVWGPEAFCLPRRAGGLPGVGAAKKTAAVTFDSAYPVMDVHEFHRERDAGRNDFRRVDLQKIDLSTADLCGIDFRGSNLTQANLTGANLCGAHLDQAFLGGARLAGADLRTASLSEADLRATDLQGADLRNARLLRANLEKADLSGADLRGANLTGARLLQAWLKRSNLHGANLSGATLVRARLVRARLVAVNFQGADLTGADLDSTILLGAILEGANLTDTKFGGAVMPDGRVH